VSGYDQKIILLDPVLANLAEGYAETRGAGPRRLRQDFHQVPLAEREAAKLGDGGLLAEQFLDLCSGVGHRHGTPSSRTKAGAPGTHGPKSPRSANLRIPKSKPTKARERYPREM